DAKRTEQIGSKGSERHHGVVGIEPSLWRFEAPMRVDATKRARIREHHHPAERAKARGISLGHGQRVGYASGAFPVDGVTKHRGEARLEFARPIEIERAVGNAELLRKRELALERLERALAAIELEPTLLAQETRRPGFGKQGLVLRQRAREQRAHQPR